MNMNIASVNDIEKLRGEIKGMQSMLTANMEMLTKLMHKTKVWDEYLGDQYNSMMGLPVKRRRKRKKKVIPEKDKPKLTSIDNLEYTSWENYGDVEEEDFTECIEDFVRDVTERQEISRERIVDEKPTFFEKLSLGDITRSVLKEKALQIFYRLDSGQYIYVRGDKGWRQVRKKNDINQLYVDVAKFVHSFHECGILFHLKTRNYYKPSDYVKHVRNYIENSSELRENAKKNYKNHF